MRRYWILLACVLFVGSLLALRIVGERAFPVEAEQAVIAPVDRGTSLFESFRQAVETSTADSTAEPGETTLYYPLGNPHKAMLSRFVLADRAERSLDVQYYLFHDDDTGRALLAQLVNAAGRGVNVRLLIDDIDVHGREDLYARLANESENLQIRIFNPTLLRGGARVFEFVARFPRVTRRMHNKSYTADGIASVVGGRNVGDEYFNIDTDMAFTDYDVIAIGNVAGKVTEEFNQYWFSGLAVDVSRLAEPAADSDYDTWRASLDSRFDRVQREIAERTDIVVTQALARSISPFVDHGEVIFDPPDKVISGFDDTEGNMSHEIRRLLSSAEEELVVSSPYFIPGESGMELIRNLRDKGVEVTVVTNSLASNDVAAVYAGYMDYRKAMLDAGVKLYEFKPTTEEGVWSVFGSSRSSLHAKLFIIDQRTTFVGSFNLDPRSAIHNTEMGIVFQNARFGERGSDRIRHEIGQMAYQVLLSEKGAIEWHEKRQDGSTIIHTDAPETNGLQRLVVYLVSWLPVEWLL